MKKTVSIELTEEEIKLVQKALKALVHRVVRDEEELDTENSEKLRQLWHKFFKLTRDMEVTL